MKTLLLSLVLCLPVSAFAKTTVITGDQARTMMETLAGAGFEVKNIDKEWNSLKEPLSVATDGFYCHFNALYPDEWMVNASCFKGTVSERGTELKNPLALAQAIRPYAQEDDAAGNRYIWLDNVQCSLEYNTHVYQCVVTVKE